MTGHERLELDLWRSLAGADGLDAALRAAAPLLARHLPLAGVPACRHAHLTGVVRNGDGTLAGPLDRDTAVVLAAPPGRSYHARHEAVLRAATPPLAAAAAADRRRRDTTPDSPAGRVARPAAGDTVVGAGGGLREVMRQVALVARSDAPVLVLGETGSGKEVVARAVHARSPRAGGPLVRVNCGAIPPELVDSELFGHERGSFTGAVAERRGWFERADGGTLFLDEVGELPPAAQVRLLRVLQDGTVERVGGDGPRRVDVRVVAATHRDLRAMAADGRFREDLWYRLAVFPVRLPPLRERAGDVPELAAHFAAKAALRLGVAPVSPTDDDVRLLAAYPWPGNVRELAAVLERAVILGEGRTLEVARALGVTPADVPARPPATLDAAVVRHIEEALEAARGRIEGASGAAAKLGVNPHTLRARMRKLGIAWDRFRPAA